MTIPTAEFGTRACLGSKLPLVKIDPRGLQAVRPIRPPGGTPGFTPIVIPPGGVQHVRDIQFSFQEISDITRDVEKVDRQIEKWKERLTDCEVAFVTICWRTAATHGGTRVTDVEARDFRSTRAQMRVRRRFPFTSGLYPEEGGAFWTCITGQIVGKSETACCLEQDRFPAVDDE